MKCSTPFTVKYPYFDALYGTTFRYMDVPCGHCINCRIEKSREWSLRCICELPYWKKAIFVTLTYDEEHYSPSLSKRDLQLFFKRLRKRVLTPIKYYACGEYGSNTNRKHFHAIIFGVGTSEKEWNYDLNCPFSENKVVEDSWTNGHVFCGSVTYHSCRYTADYIFKKYNGEREELEYKSKGLVTPFQMFSKGLGKRYFEENGEIMSRLGYISVNNTKYPLPKYYQQLIKDSVFDTSERRRRILQRRIDNYVKFCSETSQNDDFGAFDYDVFIANSNAVLEKMNEKKQAMFGKGVI